VTAPLTPGGFPLAPFEHDDPTAVGLLDLELSRGPRTSTGGPLVTAGRDALLLGRIHGEPVAVVHLDRSDARSPEDELLERVWGEAGYAIAEHCDRYGCSLDLDAASGCRGAKPRSRGGRAAVIICTAGRARQLERCLHALLLQDRPLEVLVVDNRPSDPQTRQAVDKVAAGDSRVRYVAEPHVGLSVARNRGVAETDAELVAFTDDDVVVDPGWLGWLLDAFAEPEVAVSCGLVLPFALETAAQKRFERYDGFAKGLRRRTFDAATGQARGRLLYPYINGMVGTGNSMAFRRSELIAIGGFDPALGAGSPAKAGEETCAFAAAILGGGRIVYQPRAVCWHEHRRDVEQLRGQVQAYGISVGAVLTRALISDPRFLATALRSLPVALGLQRAPRDARDAGAGAPRPVGLDGVRRRGMLLGPSRYIQGVRRARREDLYSSIPRPQAQPSAECGSAEALSG
jgi:GT2 family glycosyltransferase